MPANRPGAFPAFGHYYRCSAAGTSSSFIQMIRFHEQTIFKAFFSVDTGLGGCRTADNVFDAAVKIMGKVELNDRTKQEADTLLAQIGCAESITTAVKAGALAEGFVRGMQAVGGLKAGDAERFNIIFEEAVLQRLKSLAPTHPSPAADV
ncbi:hypothetical protein [Pseudomonas nunensis]|uniref:hypothetical protein n=1 Tax=Pseudomonas nunensis TaxID=2961896 RepID=UPI0025AFFDFA|nr:hypothetical protein [Pseudomonas nunensis]MDN3219473.1 hypothetical protein [Pseudomonas nunensis]